MLRLDRAKYLLFSKSTEYKIQTLNEEHKSLFGFPQIRAWKKMLSVFDTLASFDEREIFSRSCLLKNVSQSYLQS